jgi:hypothetical protein
MKPRRLRALAAPGGADAAEYHADGANILGVPEDITMDLEAMWRQTPD